MGAGTRAYNPSLGRFLQLDSYDVPNRYAYAQDNPIEKYDPSGHMAKWLHQMFRGLGFAMSLIGIASGLFTGGASAVLASMLGAVSTGLALFGHGNSHADIASMVLGFASLLVGSASFILPQLPVPQFLTTDTDTVYTQLFRQDLEEVDDDPNLINFKKKRVRFYRVKQKYRWLFRQFRPNAQKAYLVDHGFGNDAFNPFPLTSEEHLPTPGEEVGLLGRAKNNAFQLEFKPDNKAVDIYIPKQKAKLADFIILNFKLTTDTKVAKPASLILASARELY
jgi:hypothetical protein